MKKLLIGLLFLSLNSPAATCNGNTYLSYPSQYQIAYVAGVWDSLEFMANTLEDKGAQKFVKCLGGHTQMSQVSDALKNHYIAHPEDRLHLCSEQMIIVATKKWKCNFK